MLLADVIFDARQPEIAEFARTNALPAIYNKKGIRGGGRLHVVRRALRRVLPASGEIR